MRNESARRTATEEGKGEAGERKCGVDFIPKFHIRYLILFVILLFLWH